jgi:hypothetical protein
VGAPAVGFDRDAFASPHEVGSDRGLAVVGVDPRIDLRLGQVGGADQREEALLDVRPGRGLTDVVGVEHRLEAPGAGAARMAGELVLDRRQVEDLQDLGLIAGALEGAAPDRGGEVDEGAGDGRAGDAAHDRDVLGVQGTAVRDDTVVETSRARRHGHLDLRGSLWAQPVQRRGRAVRQDRARAASENRGEPVPLAGQMRGRDARVDASVQPEQASGPDAALGGRR